MKLPDFRSDVGLQSLKKRMGIDPQYFAPFIFEATKSDLTDVERKWIASSEGLDINDISELSFLGDRTLSYKGSRVILYIRDIGSHHSLPKFHVANCDTLRGMRQTGREHRYVISTSRSGTFRLNMIQGNRPQATYHELKVCRHCLAETGFEEANSMSRESRDRALARFSLDKFFEWYRYTPTSEVAKPDSDTAPLNLYSTDWNKITQHVKTQAGWRCQQPGCGVDLSHENLRQYLHTHHEDGNKTNNRPENLIALCIRCHANRPYHGHLKNDPKYGDFHRARRLHV